MGRKHIPAYNRNNLARQAQRRYYRGRESETAKTAQKNREAVAQVFSLCIMAALNDRYGIGETRLQRVVDEANSYTGLYARNREIMGESLARKSLDAEVSDVLPDGFLLPAIRMPKNRGERAALDERRDAAAVVAKIYARAIHRVLGFGADRMAVVMQAAAEQYEIFNGYAAYGDWYGYRKLADKMSRILHTPVDVQESAEDVPIFGRTID